MGNCRWRGGVVGLAGYFISFSSSFAQGILYAPDHQPSAWNINQKPAVWDINLAIGAAMVPTFHGSDRYRATPIPLVVIRWRDTVSLGDDGLNLYWHNSKLRIGGGVSYDGGLLDHETDGILSGGDDRLKGLGNIDASVGIRGFVSYMMGPVYFDTSAIKYIGPQNKGIVVNLSASSPLALNKHFIVRPHLGLTWVNDSYMQTFFGVTSRQASQSMFHQFNGSGGLEDVNGGLTLVWLLNRHWFLGADASATEFLGPAGRSPITISNTNATVA